MDRHKGKGTALRIKFDDGRREERAGAHERLERWPGKDQIDGTAARLGQAKQQVRNGREGEQRYEDRWNQ